MRKPIKHKLMVTIITAVVTGGLFILLQLWTQMFDDTVFWKLIVTCVLVVVVAGVLVAIFSDLQDDEKQKKDNYLS